MAEKMTTTGGMQPSVELAAQVLRLKNLHKNLAERLRSVKVLIALHGSHHLNDKGFVVRIATENLRVFIVDHRLDVFRPVEVEEVGKTATNQDFCEAFYDEAVDTHWSASELQRISALLAS